MYGLVPRVSVGNMSHSRYLELLDPIGHSLLALKLMLPCSFALNMSKSCCLKSVDSVLRCLLILKYVELDEIAKCMLSLSVTS